MKRRVRKWEDMNIDCLAKIFEGSGMETLIFSAPLVCKNWHTATLDPQCWKVLDFKSVVDSKMRNLHLVPQNFVIGDPHDFLFDPPLIYELVKYAVDRSQGIATKVVLPESEGEFEDIMNYISNGCPMLKTLVLPVSYQLYKEYGCLSKLIKKWKDLEHLTVSCQEHFHDILTEISTHCKNFVSLTTSPIVARKAARAIVTLLPKIKSLTLGGSSLDRRSLILILFICKDLEFLDIRNCEGFYGKDEEILARSSHIGTFLSDGSYLEDYYYGSDVDFDLPDDYLSG
ncbi:hypothetical protein ACHQM5_021580 [Ranunculus cassubicifolius]